MGATVAALFGRQAFAQPPARAGRIAAAPDEAWLSGLGAVHHQFFDLGKIGDNFLLRVQAFLDVYNQDYRLRDADLGVLVGVHGDGIGYVLGDAAWARFSLGRRFNIVDPATNQPATRNVFANPGKPSGSDRASVAELRGRGARFLGCNNSLRRLSRRLAGSAGSSDEIYAALESSVLEGVPIVPAMIVAVNRAQEAGFTYAALG